MTIPYASSLLLALVLVSGCSTPGSAPTPSPKAPVDTASASSAEPTEKRPGGGLPSSLKGDRDAHLGASEPSRAERDELYQRTRERFPQEGSGAVNPSQARRQANPKTLEQVSTMSGKDEVLAMSVPHSSVESVQAGKQLYLSACSACHGPDGAPERSKAGNLAAYNMADLGDPLRYKYGADARGVFRSIAFGVPAPPHGIYKKRLDDGQIWNLTSFVLSLQSARR